ncbi:hypothetical protein M434DRAFT_34955 [Hypoxylon sp. CO27-5]|nr:hypothetical protein M434DRAFT_34955 [Hypoxylon sp. CO27-5]
MRGSIAIDEAYDVDPAFPFRTVITLTRKVYGGHAVTMEDLRKVRHMVSSHTSPLILRLRPLRRKRVLRPVPRRGLRGKEHTGHRPRNMSYTGIILSAKGGGFIYIEGFVVAHHRSW